MFRAYTVLFIVRAEMTESQVVIALHPQIIGAFGAALTAGKL